MPELLVKEGESKGTTYRLADQKLTIGRDSSNNIVLPDRRISREHARIVPEEKKYIIEDLDSVNGVFVNDTRVTKHELNFGDQIRLGATILVYLPLNAPEDVKSESDISEVKILPQRDAADGLTVEVKVDPDKIKSLEEDIAGSEGANLDEAYKRLAILYRISHDLGSVVDLTELLNKIMEFIFEVLKADRGFIMLIDEDTGELGLPAVYRREGVEKDEISLSKTVINHVRNTGEAILTSDARQDSRFKESESIIIHDIRSTMCVPIKAKEKILGLLHVDTKGKVVSFTKQDLELLTAISNQAAVAIENAKLFENLKKANKELKQQQAQLIEAEKMSALGRLAGGVAHEINNPMTSISGYSDLASQTLAKGELSADDMKDCKDYVKIIADEAQRCKNIAQTLLQFGRRKKAQMAPININNVMDAALAVAHFHMKRGKVEIKKELASQPPEIVGDAGQLQQVFLNFIINAKDAIMEQGGGILNISTMHMEEGDIVVKFADTGCGIPEDKIEEIFKPLFTTKEEGKGTGLGLSISIDIIESHKGTIEVDSTVGKGTTFTIKLPINKDTKEGSGDQ